MLNGTKQYITTGSNAEGALMFAGTDPAQGKRGISAFIVETDSPGYRVGRIEKKMGQNASDTCEIQLDNLEVPVANRPARKARATASRCPTWKAAASASPRRRWACPRGVRMALAYAQERRSFGKGSRKPGRVAIASPTWPPRSPRRGRWCCTPPHCAAPERPCLTEASMAKLFASEMAEQVCSDAVQTFGGAGYIAESGVERIYRAVRVTRSTKAPTTSSAW